MQIVNPRSALLHLVLIRSIRAGNLINNITGRIFRWDVAFCGAVNAGYKMYSNPEECHPGRRLKAGVGIYVCLDKY